MLRSVFSLIALVLTSGVGVRCAVADLFVIRDDTGTTVELEARLAGSGSQVLALELADGQYQMVPEAAVERREAKDGPVALDHNAVAARLREKFGSDKFHSLVREPYVIGLVLATPLPKNAEGRAKSFLTKAGTFLKNVDTAFTGFLKDVKIAARPPTHPLVVLIFETQEGFESYANSDRIGVGLASENLSGYYSKLSNRLAIRMGECNTFDVPLHEAIHQLVYNRGVFQRLAPIPAWFDEGIATGFEGNQGKVGIGPTKISPRYARAALAATNLTFEKMLDDDAAFRGDVLAGEAYGGAWGLHWLLVSKYRGQYSKYVKLLAEKEPLTRDEPGQRLREFQETFGKELTAVDKEFRPYLESGIRKQKVELHPQKKPGVSTWQQGVADVEMTGVVGRGAGDLEVHGKLTNVSPLRAMAFYVTVETDAGTYAEWHIPQLDIQKTIALPAKSPVKPLPGARGGASRSYRVRIRAAPPDSEEAGEWSSGKLPVPRQ